MGRPPFRRRQFLLIDFQNRMLLFTFLYYVTTVVIFAAVLFVPLVTQLDADGLSPQERGIVAGEFLSLHYRFWPAIPLVFILLGAHSILISHRVAGPLYRLRQVFRAVAEGNLSGSVHLRKNDYLKEDAVLVSEMLDSLRKRVREIDSLGEKLQLHLSELRSGVERGVVPETRDQLTVAEEVAGELRARLLDFTLDEGR